MEGQWKDGKLHGFGRTIDQQGNCYIGLYENGLRSGEGCFIWANGDIFDGFYKNNEINGWGTLYYAKTGEACNGLWENGLLDIEIK